MAKISYISPQEFNSKLAVALKEFEEFKQPEWSLYVKTSPHKQRPSFESDFWYKRTASILRQISVKGIAGVNRLRTRYGGRKDRGMQPPTFVPAGGKMIRVILQQAESAGLIEKAKGKKAGRQLTSKGKELLESIK